ncbi:3-deoxy-manno-octulosonate cytidylyltransferase [Pokkaliibacter plantistimulans]|uniref:3-deoxy-manno-octulosonate cytidylyltransferase n=1 Tax=Proteobacteria bacterium 228 TaxID=2083153 RepID=A0A2S5KHL9_9PROT|nr:3-deoxy-manno-octulosonate cytidylyltransferase [Pokkaliibacter plantistimulans]PPC74135.1 3-deoxy-manno-octulosonate cytidylyltransferase [Pokkaliibacter plantistimulans]
MSFLVVIPARYASTRLKGKPLLDIAGKPMVQHTWEKACASGAARVIIATDDERIESMARAFGAEVCMTSAAHPSGTDRIQEVASQLKLSDDEVIVNVQGDEPMLPATLIDQVAQTLLQHPQADMATLCEPIEDMALFANPNVVKLVKDVHGKALYFSRAPVSWHRDEFAQGISDVPPSGWQAFRHIGLYSYRVGLLNQFVQWSPAPIEQWEALEQLRVLWNGGYIQVSEAAVIPPAGVDTPDDLVRVRSILGDGR